MSIFAYIHPENKSLVIEGYDCGEFVRNFQGDSDYEYWVIVQESEKRKLLDTLLENGYGRGCWQVWVSDDTRLLYAVKARFRGINEVISEIQKYCAEIGVRAEFHSY